MKNLWKKFKHWLIKKLGGYVAPTKELEIAHYTVEPIAIHTELFIENDRIKKPLDVSWHNVDIRDAKPFAKPLDDIDIEVMVKEQLAHKLAIEIVNHDLFDVQKMQGRPMFDETCFAAVVRVLPSKKRSANEYTNSYTNSNQFTNW